MTSIDLSKLPSNWTANWTIYFNLTLPNLPNDSRVFLEIWDHLKSNSKVFEKWNYQYLYHIVIFIGISILILNSYILSLFLRVKTLRHKLNIFPVNLTLSDTIVGYVVVPIFVTSELALNDTTLSEFIRTSRFRHVSRVILISSSLVNIYSLAAIVTDRTISIAFPIRHRQHFTRKKALLVISLIWLFSLAFACGSFKIYAILYKHSSVDNLIDLLALLVIMERAKRKYRLYGDAFMLLCAAGAAIVCVALMVTFIVIRRRKRASEVRRTTTSTQKRREEFKANSMLFLMFLAVMAWVVTQVSWKKAGLQKEAHVAMFLGRFCMSILNPVLYTLLKQDIKKASRKDLISIKKFLSRRCRKENTVSFTDDRNTGRDLNSKRAPVPIVVLAVTDTTQNTSPQASLEPGE